MFPGRIQPCKYLLKETRSVTDIGRFGYRFFKKISVRYESVSIRFDIDSEPRLWISA